MQRMQCCPGSVGLRSPDTLFGRQARVGASETHQVHNGGSSQDLPQGQLLAC